MKNLLLITLSLVLWAGMASAQSITPPTINNGSIIWAEKLNGPNPPTVVTIGSSNIVHALACTSNSISGNQVRLYVYGKGANWLEGPAIHYAELKANVGGNWLTVTHTTVVIREDIPSLIGHSNYDYLVIQNPTVDTRVGMKLNMASPNHPDNIKRASAGARPDRLGATCGIGPYQQGQTWVDPDEMQTLWMKGT